MIENLIAIAYSGNAVIITIGYIPQIIKLIKDETGTGNFSIFTWLLWLWTAFAGFLYAVILIQDTLMIIVTGLCVVGNSAIVFLIIYNVFFRKRKET